MHVRAAGRTLAGPEDHGRLRDIYGVLTLGHWSGFGQKHHFMRRPEIQLESRPMHYGGRRSYPLCHKHGRRWIVLSMVGGVFPSRQARLRIRVNARLPSILRRHLKLIIGTSETRPTSNSGISARLCQVLTRARATLAISH